MVIMPLVVGIPQSIRLVEDALEGNRLIGLVAMKDASAEEVQPQMMYNIGTAGRIFFATEGPGKMLQVVVELSASRSRFYSH